MIVVGSRVNWRIRVMILFMALPGMLEKEDEWVDRIC